MKAYDTIIHEGMMIDPLQGMHEVTDVAIKDGMVAKVGRGLSEDDAVEVIDATDKIVCPGFVDLHVHVYEGVSHYGINADEHCLKMGSTTVLDAGSAGADTFMGFRKYVIEVSETRIFAMLNISSLGMISPAVGELEDIRYADVQKAVKVCEKNKDVIMGIKVRLSREMVGNNGLQPLMKAKEAAEAVGRPIMVHIGDTPSPLREILIELRQGDILTHCFTGLPNGIIGKDGDVIPEAREAMKRGVIFDVGHGQGSFSFDIARNALQQGVEPNTISSDLHSYNVNGPVFDLATTASKFIHLGLPIEGVIAKITCIPADFLGLQGTIGTLRTGANADLVVLREESGNFVLEDSYGRKENTNHRLNPTMIMKRGHVIHRHNC
ncbi:MAG TPA: amidohydrolase/deacetylase family metallohydrolase [Candidatus Acidoferrum sp.]|nr:amidohydrolase/deacetylase family metallohydrolase [Candidatus Acidoferrum sp.]